MCVCVCWEGEVLPAVLYAAAFQSFSPITLFDCERGREEKERGGQEVPVAFCTALCQSFSFWRRQESREEEKRWGRRPLLACQELSHNPEFDLRRTVRSLSIQPPLPSPPSFFTPLPANLHYSSLCPPSFLLFLSHLPPLLLLGQRYLARLIVM